jgi:hypothetical protein
MTGAIDAFEKPTANELGSGLEAAQTVYLESMQARYFDESMGGGAWAELAPATQKERAELGFNPTRPILIRTHALANALARGSAGNFYEVLPDRIRAGIGGSEIHPGYKPGGESGTMTYGEIAYLHQTGTARMPARRILVQPATATLDAMQAAVLRATESMWARVTGGSRLSNSTP